MSYNTQDSPTTGVCLVQNVNSTWAEKSYSGWSVRLHPTDFGFSHMTCFGQWDVSRREPSSVKGAKCTRVVWSPLGFCPTPQEQQALGEPPSSGLENKTHGARPSPAKPG